MQIPQKIFSPLGTSLYFHANPSKKKSFVLSSNMVALSCVYKKINAVAICLAAGKGDRIVGRTTPSLGASEKGIFQQGIVDGFL